MLYLTDTAVVLTTSDDVRTAHSNLMLVVEDQQNLSCPKPQKLTVFFCDCTEIDDCSNKEAIKRIGSKPALGSAGIGLLFLGVLAMLRECNSLLISLKDELWPCLRGRCEMVRENSHCLALISSELKKLYEVKFFI